MSVPFRLALQGGRLERTGDQRVAGGACVKPEPREGSENRWLVVTDVSVVPLIHAWDPGPGESAVLEAASSAGVGAARRGPPRRTGGVSAPGGCWRSGWPRAGGVGPRGGRTDTSPLSYRDEVLERGLALAREATVGQRRGP